MVFKKGENSSANPNRLVGEYQKERAREVQQIAQSNWAKQEAANKAKDSER